MDKQPVVCPDNGLSLSDKNQWTRKPRKIWVNLQCMLLRAGSQSEKPGHCITPVTWHSEIGKITEAVKRSVVARILGRVGRDLDKWGTGVFRVVKVFCRTAVCMINYMYNMYKCMMIYSVNRWYSASVKTHRTLQHKEWNVMYANLKNHSGR